MSSLNQVQLIGNLGQDPEIRHTQDGSPIAQLSVATTESWKDKAGQWQDRTQWHRIVVFNEHLAKYAGERLKKGQKIFIQGALQNRKWTDNSGVEKYVTEIVLQKFRGEIKLLDRVERDSQPDEQPNNSNNFDSEIPF